MGVLLKFLAVGIGLLTLAAMLPAAADERPTTPKGLWHNDEGGTEVLHWSPSTDDGAVLGYDIYKDAEYQTTVHVTELRGVASGSWQVVAFDDGGNYSERSEPKNIEGTTAVAEPDPAQPDPEQADEPSVPDGRSEESFTPSGLDVYNDAGVLVLRWNPSTNDGNIHGYDIYLNDGYHTSVSDPELRGVSVGETYKVVAVDGDGNYSSKSPGFTVADNASQAPGGDGNSSGPTSPQNIRVERSPDVVGGTQELVWDRSSDDKGVAGYDIFKNDSYHTTIHHNTRAPITALSPGDTIMVRAFDGDRNFSEPSQSVLLVQVGNRLQTQLLTDEEVDAAPTAPVITSLAENDDGVLVMTWTRSRDLTDIDRYNIYGTNGSLIGTTGSNSTTYTSRDFHYGESYYVTAIDSQGNLSDRSASYGLPMSIRGEPQTSDGVAQMIAAMAVEPSYDPDDVIREHLSNLFSQFAPIRGDSWQGENSQKRQRDYNRAIANAVLGMDHTAMTTHWSPLGVGDQMLWLMTATETLPGTSTVTAGPGEFLDTWRHATELERLDYLGIDSLRWELSRVFYEAYRTNMSNLYEMSRAETEFYTNLVVGLFVGFVTGDLLSAYGIIGGAAGGFAGAATTSALNGGSTEEILEDGAIGAIKGALSSWISEEYDLSKWEGYTVSGTIAAIEWGLSGGSDPLVGTLASMVPEVAEKAEELDQYTLEEATDDAIEALTPIFGAQDAERFVLHTTQAVAALLGELLVLIALVPTIDVQTEADRIIPRVINETLGGDRDSLLFVMGDHVESVVNNAIGASVQNAGNPAAVAAAARGLNPTIAAFLGSTTLTSPEEIRQDIVDLIVGYRAGNVPLSQWSQRARNDLEQRWGFDLFR